jgi:type III restriction enzyme
MAHLHQVLAGRVDRWREDGYGPSLFPAIAEILDWARDPDTGVLRFLRAPQFRALETYWYLRLVEGAPHVFTLYERLFPDPPDRLEALGLTSPAIARFLFGRPAEELWARIKADDEFVRAHRLESIRETLTLGYPSYILALAMGAGKTILIGAIVATEFGMALEYPDAPFVQNALVFAPGKTIIESLRELAGVPYDRILPPRLHKPFSASVKLTFTRDGERDIPVVRGSVYNVIVTNTEKIRIQKETVRKSDLGSLLNPLREDEARAEVANLRLQAIASLTHLGIFSDEAHHTYGQSLQTELKKVRKTVDYLATTTNVVAVVNTTGTPYFRRQPLRDVVIWYGLAQGIRDNILKDVSGNIFDYHFEGDAGAYVSHVVEDFFRDYGDLRLPDGAPARLALYFPQTNDLEELRPVIEATLVRVGQSPALCLRNTSDSTVAEIDAFNRLNDPAAPHRVILLVNKGTEGWNCPSLFACALARRLTTSNNFVLQAATRCLRQIPGNNRKARIYLSRENRAILDRQLQETYGETLAGLNQASRQSRSTRLVLRKPTPAPIVLTRQVKRVVPANGPATPLRLTRPVSEGPPVLTRAALDIAERPGLTRVLRQVGDAVRVETVPAVVDHYEAAVDLAAIGRLDPWVAYDELRRLYPDGEDIPEAHLGNLAAQIAGQNARWEEREECAEVALEIVKPRGFQRAVEAEQEVYVTEITYPADLERHILHRGTLRENPVGFGFHYDPYNFDSGPERDFFVEMLHELNTRPAEVEDIYFTGGLTDPAKTDVYVEYKGEDGRWHRYTPDFVIRKRPRTTEGPGSGRLLLVELKARQHEAAVRDAEARFARGEEAVTNEGRKVVATRRLERLNPERLKYELVFVNGTVTYQSMNEVRRFVREPDRARRPDLDHAQRLRDAILAADGGQVARIILFGSRARGDAKPDSDFDILVTVRGLALGEIREYRLTLYRALRGTGVVAEPWVMDEEEFEETRSVVGGLAYPAWKEGVVLYEKS